MKKALGIAAVAVALLASGQISLAGDLKVGGQPKLKVKQVQLGIKSPTTNACPTKAQMNIWVFTNKPGSVPIYVARAGGSGVSGPYMVQTKATGNGKFMGTYSRTLPIHQPVDTRYRASAPSFGALSNWVPLKASCKIGLGGNGQIKN
jgi:hypothetical protein